jgi:hypothetical protein
VLFAFRRDALVAALLFGMLWWRADGRDDERQRRHADPPSRLALLHIVWLSAVGACELAYGARQSRRSAHALPRARYEDGPPCR